MDFGFGPKMMRSSTMYMFKRLFRIEQSSEGLKDSKKARLRCSRCIVPRNSLKMQVQITFSIQFFKAVSPLLSIIFYVTALDVKFAQRFFVLFTPLFLIMQNWIYPLWLVYEEIFIQDL